MKDRILKDGYWDRTSVINVHGGLRVRKESKETDNPGPWAHAALREEIRYLQTLPDETRADFPELLECQELVYEMPFYEGFPDVARLLCEGALDQDEADRIVGALAEALFERIQTEERGIAAEFFAHVAGVITATVEVLEEDKDLRNLVRGDDVVINGRTLPSIRGALEVLPELSCKMVRLHGDLILENMLWDGERLILVDPVSVAGIWEGPPEFDLVKHVSFASGELFAIREEIVDVGEDGSGGWIWRPCWDAIELAPFLEVDLSSGIRSAFERTHGPPDRRLCHLIDGYFSLAMAINTDGVQRWARVLKAGEELGFAVTLPD